jgi:hypothetical protein
MAALLTPLFHGGDVRVELLLLIGVQNVRSVAIC